MSRAVPTASAGLSELLPPTSFVSACVAAGLNLESEKKMLSLGEWGGGCSAY
jgi:hypothetical protein